MSYIYQQINESAFHDAFERMGRTDQYSYEGRKALYEHLNELAAAQGVPIKLDVIALCCEFYEGTAKDIAQEYNVGADEGQELSEAVAEYLLNEGALVAEYDVYNDAAGEKTAAFLYTAH